jgi:hypothetical protein
MIEWLGKLVSIILYLLIPEFLLIPFLCNPGIGRNSEAWLGIRVDEFRNCWN